MSHIERSKLTTKKGLSEDRPGKQLKPLSKEGRLLLIKQIAKERGMLQEEL